MKPSTRLRRAERHPDGTCRICGGDVPVPLVQTNEWLDLRTRILAALRPFPEARKAVVDAIAKERP